ncbi:MAG: hypothetical protein ACRC42_04665, partial [Mycoplasma sp.]
ELAKIYLDHINKLTNICNNQIAELNQARDADIVGFYINEDKICINIFNYINGKLLVKHEYINQFYDDANESIISYLMQFYSNHNIPKNIYIDLPKELSLDLSLNLNTKIQKPIKGIYSELLLNAIKNAKEFLSKNQLSLKNIYDKTIGAQEQLRDILKMSYLNQIDIIDNSNLFLEDCVSAIVVYKNGVPEKKLYRKFIIKNLEQKSDYHFMQEVIFRKYSKSTELPQLLIVDGGKPQISAAKEIINELNLQGKIKIIGLVKDAKHKTQAIMDSEYNLIEINKQSNLFFFLTNVQNEVHRFAISFYRQKNIKSKLNNILDDIPGLGPKYKNKLIAIYPNLYDLKNVDLETISQIIPKNVAENVINKIRKELNG